MCTSSTRLKTREVAGANGLLGGWVGAANHSEEREMRERKGEKGRERTFAMRNGPDALARGSSSEEGW